MEKISRIYIMAPGATGKSTFANANPIYAKHRVVDFATFLPEPRGILKVMDYLGRRIGFLKRIARNSQTLEARKPENYYKNIFAYLREQDESVVVFGRLGPKDISHYEDIRFGIVMLAEDQHRKQCEMRKKQLRNFLPFMNHWTTDFENMKSIRDNFINYSEKHNIKIYLNFTEAINDLSKQKGHRLDTFI